MVPELRWHLTVARSLASYDALHVYLTTAACCHLSWQTPCPQRGARWPIDWYLCSCGMAVAWLFQWLLLWYQWVWPLSSERGPPLLTDSCPLVSVAGAVAWLWLWYPCSSDCGCGTSGCGPSAVYQPCPVRLRDPDNPASQPVGPRLDSDGWSSPPLTLTAGLIQGLHSLPHYRKPLH